nr:hypothetical protein BaRGS_003158 [Batillaria attramentaria]
MRRFTAFVKAVPGFSQLPLKDQIRLIRDNRCEFGMLSMYHGFNKDLKVIRTLSSECYKWMKTKPFGDFSQIKDNALLVEWFSNRSVISACTEMS